MLQKVEVLPEADIGSFVATDCYHDLPESKWNGCKKVAKSTPLYIIGR